MIEQLIFDCDGVLVDSEIIAAHVMVEELANHDIHIDVDYYLTHCSGRTFTGLIHELPLEFNKPALPPNFLDKVIAEHDRRSRLELQSINGIASVLAAIELPKSVVSNSEIYQVEHSINHIGAAHFFENRIFSAEMVENPKPHPDVYLLAANTLQVHPSNCLVVEDSVSGATAALTAGMTVIGFTAGSHIISGHRERLLKAGVSQVANSADELTKFIRQYSGLSHD